MLSEFDAKTHMGKTPIAWGWLNGSAQPAGFDSSSGFDFWKIPFSYATPGREPDALDAPGSVQEGAANIQRNASRQILNTQQVMTMLLGLPDNRAALQKVSADRYFIPTWDNTWAGKVIPSPGPDCVLNTSDDSTEQLMNFPGIVLRYQGKTFRYLGAPAIATNPAAGPNWAETTASLAPILMDGWNNPILFVPGTGLRVRLLNGQGSFNKSDVRQTSIIVSPEGKVDRNNAGVPFVVKPGRPFFVSAGADGDFSTGDDNIYSFEQ